MNVFQQFLQLPVSEQKRIVKVSRQIARASRHVFTVEHVATTLVEISYARRENSFHDRSIRHQVVSR